MKSLFVSFAALCVFSSAASAADLPVSKVILSTSGLAHFEHRAKVDGDAQLEFPVRLEQVDDILKSLVVFDRDGRLGGVTLPGKQPLAQIFRDLPFKQNQLNNPMLLLNAYQGAAVTVTTKEGVIKGTLVQVTAEQVIDDEGRTETKHRITLMTAEGLRQAWLEEAQSLQFDDSRIKDEIARALAAIRENGTAGQRNLTVSLLGDKSREVALSYVVDAPLWKSAYRMVVPPAGGEKGLLQGWAVIENMTASDWSDVDLTLTSGNPVTFKQQLYQSYYVDRPEIPVQVFGRIMPRVDEGVVATAEEVQKPRAAMKRAGLQMQRAGGGASALGDSANAMMEMAAAPPMPAAAPMGFSEGFTGAAADSMAYEADMASVAQTANAAQSAEATTQVLFRFPDRFSLKSGQSMMLPFVSRDVPMARVSLYQPETHARHPLAAVEMTNDGDSGLPPGVLTLYEESDVLKGTAFVGDAQLPVLAAGEKRLVSYALDSKTTVDRENKSSTSEGKVSISQGILRTAMKTRSETTYTVKAPPKEDRVVILEHPRQGDHELVKPDPKSVEVTQGRYRIRVAVKAGESAVVPVVLERTLWQSYGISGMDVGTLLAYADGKGELDADTRKVFTKLADIRREMDAIDQQIYARENERQTIFSDQERVRQNLESLSGKSDLQQKYLSKMNEQEDRIVALDKEVQNLRRQREAKEAELSRAAAGISFE